MLVPVQYCHILCGDISAHSLEVGPGKHSQKFIHAFTGSFRNLAFSYLYHLGLIIILKGQMYIKVYTYTQTHKN